MEDIRVSSWIELHEQLYEGSWHEPLARFRSDFAFRGMSRADSDLTTSLVRLGGDPHELERHLLRNFRKYAARGDVPVDSLWNWLALGQHHGLPTRLLDGVVWCVDYVQAHRRAPAALRRCLEDEGANLFTTEMLDRAAKDLDGFDALRDEDFVVFVEPPSFDERIVNQYALFSLGSSPSLSPDEWLGQHPELARRVVVPAELKWEIRDKLDQANISERVLFPGLDGLSRWVARYYRPR